VVHGSPLGWLTNRAGYVVDEHAAIWLADRVCRWRCSCPTCTADTGQLQLAPQMGVRTMTRRSRKEYQVGDRVWLTPGTSSAPSAAYKQPAGRVTTVHSHGHGLANGYTVTLDDGEVIRRIHCDNVTDRNPHSAIRAGKKYKPSQQIEGAQSLF
jgi:hypothetical protein